MQKKKKYGDALAIFPERPGGLNLSRSCLDRDSRSRQKKADRDSRENLNSFKILVWTIENSRSRLRYLDLVSMAICKSNTSQSRLRLFKTCRDFCVLFVIFVDFSIFFSILNEK